MRGKAAKDKGTVAQPADLERAIEIWNAKAQERLPALKGACYWFAGGSGGKGASMKSRMKKHYSTHKLMYKTEGG